MKWRIAAASEVGTTHATQKGFCQDYSLAAYYAGLDKHGYLVAFAADGSGSALSGWEGAREACRYAHSIIKEWVSNGSIATLDDDLVRTWIKAVQKHLKTYAEISGNSADDLACTFLGSVIGSQVAAFFQVGDGGIVAGCEGQLALIFWPQNGEYVNETIFLTDSDALDHLNVSIQSESIDELALFTDGLQRLVIDYATRKIHPPFFDPLFEFLITKAVAPGDKLNVELSDLLRCSKISELTDDDITLVLAVRRSLPKGSSFTCK